MPQEVPSEAVAKPQTTLLETARLDAGLLRKDLAGATGVHIETIEALEQRTAVPRDETLIKLARALPDVSAGDLRTDFGR